MKNTVNIMPREELKLGTGMRDKGKDSVKESRGKP